MTDAKEAAKRILIRSDQGRSNNYGAAPQDAITVARAYLALLSAQAAPDMLEALKKCREQCIYGDELEGVIDAAIAKAEGSKVQP